MSCSNVFLVGAGLLSNEIGNKVVQALQIIVREYVEQKVKNSAGCMNIVQYNNMVDNEWEKLYYRVKVSTYDFNHFMFVFSYDGKARVVNMITNCGFDYKDVDDNEDKIIFSINNWGSSEKIINLIADTIKDYGKTYKIVDDCNGDWEEVL